MSLFLQLAEGQYIREEMKGSSQGDLDPKHGKVLQDTLDILSDLSDVKAVFGEGLAMSALETQVKIIQESVEEFRTQYRRACLEPTVNDVVEQIVEVFTLGQAYRTYDAVNVQRLIDWQVTDCVMQHAREKATSVGDTILRDQIGFIATLSEF